MTTIRRPRSVMWRIRSAIIPRIDRQLGAVGCFLEGAVLGLLLALLIVYA